MHLLDTNICSALMAPTAGPAPRIRFLPAMSVGRQVAASSVVLHELCFGVAISPRRAADQARLSKLFEEAIVVCAFDETDARAAASIRADLRSKGSPRGPYDVLIAGQALARGATLVTADASEFPRVVGLSWEDWTA